MALVTGVCDMLYNCVIGEIGVSNSAGKPYPTAGFTSVFVMAHEIGHNLGKVYLQTNQTTYYSSKQLEVASLTIRLGIPTF